MEVRIRRHSGQPVMAQGWGELQLRGADWPQAPSPSLNQLFPCEPPYASISSPVKLQ